MVRGFRRLIDDIRNPRASKKDRKKKIDSIPDLPGIRSKKGPFKAPFILKGAKELGKVFVDLGPEGGNPRYYDPPTPPIITRHTQEQLDYEANLVRWSPQPQETIEMNPIEALAEVVNNPDIIIDDRLQNLINSATVGMDPRTGEMGRIEELGLMDSRNRDSIDSRQFERQNLLPRKKRKVSAYSKRFGIELKKLKKLHPRTKVQDLMKRAHRATKRAMK